MDDITTRVPVQGEVNLNEEAQASDDDDVILIEPVIETVDLTTEMDVDVEDDRTPSSTSAPPVQENGIQCCICLGSPVGRVPLTSVTCGHIYCAECINQWMRQIRNCPLCRKPLKARKALMQLHFWMNSLKSKLFVVVKIIKFESYFMCNRSWLKKISGEFFFQSTHFSLRSYSVTFN